MSKAEIHSIEEYMQNHRSDVLLEQLNAVYSVENSKLDEDLQQAQSELFYSEDW
jgi:hypothetical protein